MSELRDSARWLAGELKESKDAVKALSAPQLANSSIEAGKVEEYDAEGTLVAVVGEQFDGTHAAVTLAGPVPPEPVAPTVTPGVNTAEVRWNGKFVDDALSPMDFSHVTVHASRLESFDPDATTQRATITGESGDTATLALDSGEWYFLLVAVSKAGKWSDPSEAVLAEVEDYLQDAVTDALIDLDAKYDGVIEDAGQLDGRLTQAQADLVDHNTRITDAETDLADAFGQLGTVDTRIDTAKQATLTAAASDAQTKADTALAAANAQVAQVVAKGMNLVRNGDFEAGADGWATSSFHAVESGTSRSGVKSLRIGPNPGGNVWPLSEWVPATSGRTYYLEAWFKRTGEEVKPLGAGFVVQVKTSAGGSATFTTGQVASTSIATTSWTKLTATYTPATADIVSVHFAPWIVAGNNVYNVDDMLVVDITEAQAALAKANQAQTDATAAQTAAGNAQTTATNALTMATSKSKVYYSTSAPSGTGTSAGDLWRQRDGSNAIVGEWQWSDAATPAWVKQTVSGSNVSNMDVGYLTAGAATMSQALIDKLVAGTANFQRADIKNLFATAGTLDTAVIDKLWTDVVNSHKITTTMLAVGSFDNIIPDPEFTNTNSEWGAPGGYYSFPATEGRSGGGAFKITPNTAQAGKYSTYIRANGAATYLVSVWVKSDVAIPAGGIGLYINRKLTASGGAGGAANVLKQSNGAAGNDPIAANTWTRLTGVATVDASWYSFAIGLYKQTNFTTGTTWFSDPMATRMNAGELVVDGSIKAKQLEVDMVLVNDIIAGNPAGQHARMTPTGFKVFSAADGGAPSEVVRMGYSDGDDVVGVVGTDGVVRAGMNADGKVTGQDMVVANDITLAGDSLLERLNAMPKGVVAWRQFPRGGSNYPTLGAAGGEVGLFEIGWDTSQDNPARLYSVSVPPILLKATSGGGAGTLGLIMRYTDDGTPPTTSSSLIVHDYGYASGGGFGSRGFNDVLISSANGPYIRVLVTMWANVGVSVDTQGLPEVIVEDKGLAIPQTGSITTGGGGSNPPPADPVVTKTVTYSSTSVKSFQGNNSVYAFDTAKGYQGLSPAGYGNLKSLWTFPSITGILTGATVNKVEAYFYFEHWYNGSGGTARIVAHGNSGQPATYSSLILAISSTNWPRGAGRWVTIPSSLYAGFKSGTYKGFGLEGDGTYNTYGIASAAKIRVTYTK